MEKEIFNIYPKENCKSCYGTGFVSGDWVDYGSTKAQLPDEYCDCILDQLPEDYDFDLNVVQTNEEHYPDLFDCTKSKNRKEVKLMKLYATVVLAFAALVYAIMRAYAPDLPFTQDQVLTVILLALGWLGVTVTEEQVRAFFVARGFKGFK